MSIPSQRPSLHSSCASGIGLVIDSKLRSGPGHGRHSRLQVDRIFLSMAYFVAPHESFLTACERGDVVSVRKILQSEPGSIYYRSGRGVTPLLLAIEGGHFEVCKTLLENSVDVNSTFGRSQTSALSWALRCRQLKLVRLFMQYGGCMHHLSNQGWSPIFYLRPHPMPYPAAGNFLELVRSSGQFVWLHQRFTDVKGWSVLSRCTVYGTVEDVKPAPEVGSRPFRTGAWH